MEHPAIDSLADSENASVICSPFNASESGIDFFWPRKKSDDAYRSIQAGKGADFLLPREEEETGGRNAD